MTLRGARARRRTWALAACPYALLSCSWDLSKRVFLMVRTPSQTLPAPTNPNCGRMEFCQGPREDRCWALPSFLMRVAYRSSPHLNLLLNVNSCLPRRKPRRKQAGMRELCRPNLEVRKAAGTCLHLHACRSVATISALLTQPTRRSAGL